MNHDIEERCPTCGAIGMDAPSWDRLNRTGYCDEYCKAESEAYCRVCECKLMPTEEQTCRSCAGGDHA